MLRPWAVSLLEDFLFFFDVLLCPVTAIRHWIDHMLLPLPLVTGFLFLMLTSCIHTLSVHSVRGVWKMVIKFKGGAEKAPIKKRKALETDAAKYANIGNFFNKTSRVDTKEDDETGEMFNYACRPLFNFIIKSINLCGLWHIT